MLGTKAVITLASNRKQDRMGGLFFFIIRECNHFFPTPTGTNGIGIRSSS